MLFSIGQYISIHHTHHPLLSPARLGEPCNRKRSCLSLGSQCLPVTVNNIITNISTQTELALPTNSRVTHSCQCPTNTAAIFQHGMREHICLPVANPTIPECEACKRSSGTCYLHELWANMTRKTYGCLCPVKNTLGLQSRYVQYQQENGLERLPEHKMSCNNQQRYHRPISISEDSSTCGGPVVSTICSKDGIKVCLRLSGVSGLFQAIKGGTIKVVTDPQLADYIRNPWMDFAGIDESCQIHTDISDESQRLCLQSTSHPLNLRRCGWHQVHYATRSLYAGAIYLKSYPRNTAYPFQLEYMFTCMTDGFIKEGQLIRVSGENCSKFMHIPDKKERCIPVIGASLPTEFENILQRGHRINRSSFLSRTFIASILCFTKESSDQSKNLTGSLLTLNTAGAKLEQPALTIWIASSLFVLCLLIGYQIIARSKTCGNRQRNPATNVVVLHPALHIESELRTGHPISCEWPPPHMLNSWTQITENSYEDGPETNSRVQSLLESAYRKFPMSCLLFCSRSNISDRLPKQYSQTHTRVSFSEKVQSRTKSSPLNSDPDITDNQSGNKITC